LKVDDFLADEPQQQRTGRQEREQPRQSAAQTRITCAENSQKLAKSSLFAMFANTTTLIISYKTSYLHSHAELLTGVLIFGHG